MMDESKKLMVIVVGPSGVGKSSLVERAVKDMPFLEDIVTFTTRSMREGESEGFPYHFVSEDKFKELIQQNHFVEWAQVHNCYYGTPIEQITKAWSIGKTIIMDIDVQGAKTFIEKFPNQALTLFILPPSIDALSRRLEARDHGKTSNLQLRLENAKKEMAQAKDFDHQLVNDEFEKTYAQFKKIIEDRVKNS